MAINLGDKVQDRITGLSGIVVARTEWLYGCVRCTVQPQEMKDGKAIDSQTIDEPQLIVLQRAVIADAPVWRAPEEEQRAAGPRPEMTRRPEPKREGA